MLATNVSEFCLFFTFEIYVVKIIEISNGQGMEHETHEDFFYQVNY